MRTFKFIIAILFSALVVNAFSQQVSFSGYAKKVVSVGERFTITYSVNADGDNFTAPNLSGFNVLQGPSTSSSSSIQVINGRMSQSVSLSFTYIVEATKEGKYSINPAQIRVNGKFYKSNIIAIEVVKGNAPAQQQQTNAQQQQASSGNASDDDLFVRVNVNKTSVYEGEPIVASLKVYIKANSGMQLSNFNEYKFPSFKGFYSQVIEEAKQISLQREAVNGKVYESGLFKKVLLYPQVNGNITIDPFMLECIYVKRVARASWFDDGYREFSKKCMSRPIVITIKPLPAGAPASFGGAVGEFGLSVGVNKTTVKTNEAITLRLKINGTGNLKLANHGKIDFPPDFEAYDPKLTDSYKNTLSGTTGSKTWEYLVIPRHSGTFTIPSVLFSYFDPKTGKYKELSSDKFTITVEKGSADEQNTVVQGVSKEDVKFLGSDIRYIMTKSSVSKPSGKLYGSPFLWFLYIIPFVSLIVIIILRRKQLQENSNISVVKNKRANKVSRKRLKLAEQYMKDNKDAAFYEEVMKASWGYMSDKLDIPLSVLTKDSITDELNHKNINAELGKRLIELLDQCEFARFAPSAAQQSKEHLYTEAEFLINEFERVL